MSIEPDLAPLEADLDRLNNKPEWAIIGQILCVAIRQLDRIATVLEKFNAQKEKETAKPETRNAQRSGRAAALHAAVPDQEH